MGIAGTGSNRRGGDGEFSAGSKKHSVRCHQLTYFSAASKKYLVRCHQLTSSSWDRRWKEAEVVVTFFNSNKKYFVCGDLPCAAGKAVVKATDAPCHGNEGAMRCAAVQGRNAAEVEAGAEGG